MPCLMWSQHAFSPYPTPPNCNDFSILTDFAFFAFDRLLSFALAGSYFAIRVFTCWDFPHAQELGELQLPLERKIGKGKSHHLPFLQSACKWGSSLVVLIEHSH